MNKCYRVRVRAEKKSGIDLNQIYSDVIDNVKGFVINYVKGDHQYFGKRSQSTYGIVEVHVEVDSSTNILAAIKSIRNNLSYCSANEITRSCPVK